MTQHPFTSENSALLLIDHQVGTMQLIKNILVESQKLEENLPEAFAARIQRSGIVNAWADSNFEQAVKATGRSSLIMAGVTTDVCLVFPAINAIEDGFRVQAVVDASGSPFELSEEMSRRRMQDAGVVLTATNTIMAELAQD